MRHVEVWSIPRCLFRWLHRNVVSVIRATLHVILCEWCRLLQPCIGGITEWQGTVADAEIIQKLASLFQESWEASLHSLTIHMDSDSGMPKKSAERALATQELECLISILFPEAVFRPLKWRLWGHLIFKNNRNRRSQNEHRDDQRRKEKHEQTKTP